MSVFRLLFRRRKTYAEVVMEQRPYGYWPLDDPPEHDPIVWDHSGNERHGESRDA
jgi:hypothetical protein